ncbi:MAG: YggT family protein [Gammaproteobacteria bacterium]|nr:YggT family protein [Gammaproteobacteria bacterium]
MTVILILVLRLFGVLCLLRFLFQLAGANMYNPLVQGFARATNPVLQPLRRFLPKHRLIDFSSGLVVLIAFFLVQCLSSPEEVKEGVFHLLLISGAVTAIIHVCWIFIGAILLTVIMSWVAPNVYSPATELARVLTEPVLRPLRKVLPAMAGFDFSPMLAMVGLSFILYFLRPFS